MADIKLDGATIVDEAKEKLKALKKYEVSDEFTLIKNKSKALADSLEETIGKKLEARKKSNEFKEEGHKAIFSELDKMLLADEFLDYLIEQSTNVVFISEIQEKKDNLKTHLFLRDGNFDFCVFSELDYIKERYKLYLGTENTLKQIITSYELLETKINIDETINPYSEIKKSDEQILKELDDLSARPE